MNTTEQQGRHTSEEMGHGGGRVLEGKPQPVCRQFPLSGQLLVEVPTLLLRLPEVLLLQRCWVLSSSSSTVSVSHHFGLWRRGWRESSQLAKAVGALSVKRSREEEEGKEGRGGEGGMEEGRGRETSEGGEERRGERSRQKRDSVLAPIIAHRIRPQTIPNTCYKRPLTN